MSITFIIPPTTLGERLFDITWDVWELPASPHLGCTSSWKAVVAAEQVRWEDTAHQFKREVLAASLTASDDDENDGKDSFINVLLDLSDADKERAYRLLYNLGCRIYK